MEDEQILQYSLASANPRPTLRRDQFEKSGIEHQSALVHNDMLCILDTSTCAGANEYNLAGAVVVFATKNMSYS